MSQDRIAGYRIGGRQVRGVSSRSTEPSHGTTTIHYHIMRSVVHHSKIAVDWQLWVNSLHYRAAALLSLHPS